MANTIGSNSNIMYNEFRNQMAKSHEGSTSTDNENEAKLEQFLQQNPNIMVYDEATGTYMAGPDMENYLKFLRGSIPAELYNDIQSSLDKMFEEQNKAPNLTSKQAVVSNYLDEILDQTLESYDYPPRSGSFNSVLYATPSGQEETSNNSNSGNSSTYNQTSLDALLDSDANILRIMFYVFAAMSQNAEDIMRVDVQLLSANKDSSSVLNGYKGAMAAFQGLSMPTEVAGDPEIDFLGPPPKNGEGKVLPYQITNMFDLFRIVYGQDAKGNPYPQSNDLKDQVAPLYEQLKKYYPDDIDELKKLVWDVPYVPKPANGQDATKYLDSKANKDKAVKVFGDMFANYETKINVQIELVNPKLSKIVLWSTDSGGIPTLGVGTKGVIGSNIGNVDLAIGEATTLSTVIQSNAKLNQNTYATILNLLNQPTELSQTVRRIIYGS